MNNVFVKPRLIDGKPAIVRDPITKNPLAAGGEWKTKNQFWVRRIKDGDVIDETAQQLASGATPAPVKSAPAIGDEPASSSKSKS